MDYRCLFLRKASKRTLCWGLCRPVFCRSMLRKLADAFSHLQVGVNKLQALLSCFPFALGASVLAPAGPRNAQAILRKRTGVWLSESKAPLGTEPSELDASASLHSARLAPPAAFSKLGPANTQLSQIGLSGFLGTTENVALWQLLLWLNKQFSMPTGCLALPVGAA